MPTYQIDPAGVTDTGNVRAINQDFLLDEGEVFAVADGMGGHNRGEVASRVAIEALQEAFADDPTPSGLVAAVHHANQVVWQQSQEDPELAGMGTTIAAVALTSSAERRSGEAVLTVVNVGDSRVYLLPGRAALDGGPAERELSCLTVDHSLVADLVRAGQMTEDAASEHPSRNVLTQAIGVGATVAPHVAEITPTPGDRLLLCSDGLFNEVSKAEIVAVLAERSDPADAARRLVDLANEHGGSDNITAVVVDIS